MKDLAQAKDVLLTIILPQYANYGFGRWAIPVKKHK